jgi:hypothetical protein
MSEVNYFSFSDLEKKWDVNSEQLHKLIANGDLIPSLFFNKKRIIKAFNYRFYESDNIPIDVYAYFLTRKVTDGRYEEEIKDNKTEINGWHYLVFPVHNGTSKYYFETSSKNIDDYQSHGVLYRHYEVSESKKQKLIYFDNEFIEKNAEFSDEVVAAFGIKHPELNIASSKTQQAERPLLQRKERNYLRLIYDLIEANLKDFDDKKPFEAANKIIEKTNTKLSQDTIAKYITEASEVIRLYTD